MNIPFPIIDLSLDGLHLCLTIFPTPPTHNVAIKVQAVGVSEILLSGVSISSWSILAGTLARLHREAPHYKKDGYKVFNTFYVQVVRALRFLQESKDESKEGWEAIHIPRGTLQETDNAKLKLQNLCYISKGLNIKTLLFLFVILPTALLGFYMHAQRITYFLRPIWESPPRPFNILPHYYHENATMQELCQLHGWKVKESPRHVFDAVLFSNELDMLQIRWKELFLYVTSLSWHNFDMLSSLVGFLTFMNSRRIHAQVRQFRGACYAKYHTEVKAQHAYTNFLNHVPPQPVAMQGAQVTTHPAFKDMS